MVSYDLQLSAEEVINLLRAEIESGRGQPELNVAAVKEYAIEEEFDSTAYGIENGEEFDLVTSIATLTIEPRVEDGYWVLETVVERTLGPRRITDEEKFAFRELSLEEFEAELSNPGQKKIIVRVQVQSPEIREDFDRWLTDARARHAAEPQAGAP